MQPVVTCTETENWASKVKKANKNVIFSTTSAALAYGSPAHTREQKMPVITNTATVTEAEEVVAKKKKKKKKKKTSTSSNCEDVEKSQNENYISQEPPKIQDNEEFPDLVSSVRGRRHESITTCAYGSSPRLGTVDAKPKGSGKKSKVPVQLDLGGMLAALEQKQHTEKAKQSAKSVVLSVGGGIPVLAREPVASTKHQQSKPSQAPHNPLDSSAPLVKKGKQREMPKAKKPTSLKKIILKEREERKQLRASVEQEAPTSVEDISSGSREQIDTPAESADDPHPNTETGMFIKSGVGYLLVKSTDEAVIVEQEEDTSKPLSAVSQSGSTVARIHSRRFREYCSQVLSKEVDACAVALLKELVRFQDRMYQKDPVKAKTKRRLVMGLREVLKHLKLGKLKCIIISPNCEKIQSKGGLDDTLQTIIDCAREQNVPFVFALNRKALGRCVNKAVPVSVVGIFSYDGAQDHFHKLYMLTMEAREMYKDVAQEIEHQTENWIWADETKPATEPLPESKQQPDRESKETLVPEGDDEPNYIKVWKRMLEEGYKPYTMSFEEKVNTDLFNLHL
ncbi:selenocysteine insertion sequence-binding protein 2 [Spea bombifrons]|uniref:selenocysteine insertion sequence-binding protein 2 n=1 Tax=Spea bombifrons TaxID=233779 RepID=UPI00234B5A8B|nr:selenocysteine insertion sequence-binding protein 2 [Spea bombifrons]